ncbi:uncharacterized protein LOC143884494 [Tasmannia lanceolata]|uniref:uncharacterized protein LOC143884494 n=1 Tax=Tasmannia lanceolata TaxID=3420 RepID=UPI0040643CDB
MNGLDHPKNKVWAPLYFWVALACPTVLCTISRNKIRRIFFTVGSQNLISVTKSEASLKEKVSSLLHSLAWKPDGYGMDLGSKARTLPWPVRDLHKLPKFNHGLRRSFLSAS